ncbi:hypothetical protein R3P38DRAFT_3202002 [Favolaschia claudopus]|uniref:Uncharacterized protein n=1 Tax=Favolaschia claudopus TaxID=2862362 RepID=A0AAW0AW52_9AGAR
MQRGRIRNPNAIPPPARIPTRLPRILSSGIDVLDDPEDPHIPFNLTTRLHKALARHDPSLPFPGDPLPMEAVPSAVRALAYSPFPYLSGSGTLVQPLRSPQRKRVRQRQEARSAALREKRFRTMLEIALAISSRHRIRLPSSRSLYRLPNGRGPSAENTLFIEDRDYAMHELVGPTARFQMRNVDWDAINVRVVASENKAVVVLAGVGITGDWDEEVMDPLTVACAGEAAALRRRNGDYPVLFTGVGHYFNEDKPARYPGSRALDVLAMSTLFTSVPMKRLISFTNSLLEAYCPTAFSVLEDQKAQLLAYAPDAVYPCETSVFSAITLELGGPHHILSPFGPHGHYDPATWCIITSIGVYDCRVGGHIILWDIGWVLVFPPGASILLPPGLVRYSFVEVAPHEYRHENGERKDEEFAAEATRAEYTEREVKRRASHLSALESFEPMEELPLGLCTFPYRGQNPPPAPFPYN